MKRVQRYLLAGLTGTAIAVVPWLLLVGWDLSKVDAQGHLIAGRSDADVAMPMAVTLAIVVAIGLALVMRARDRSGTVFGAAGAATWALLFACCAAASRVGGANMWPIGFVMVVLPAAVAAVVVIHVVAHVVARRQVRHRPRSGPATGT